MLIPGANILTVALGALGAQTVGYRAWQARTSNEAGILVDTYAPRVEIPGSLQPVSRERVQTMGLDLSRSYALLYATTPSAPVSKDRGADRFDYAGRLYAAEGKTDWVAQEGWNGVLLVDVGAAT